MGRKHSGNNIEARLGHFTSDVKREETDLVGNSSRGGVGRKEERDDVKAVLSAQGSMENC